MPYIKKKYRDAILMSPVGQLTLIQSNELQFAITTLIYNYVSQGPINERLNEAIGCLEAVKQEVYRKRIVPINEQELFDNGDV